MTTKKYLFVLVIVFFAILAGYGYTKYNKPLNIEDQSSNYTDDNQSTSTTTGNVMNNAQPTKPLSLKERAWQFLLIYLDAARTHNITKIKSLSYQISDVCIDASKKAECNNRMDTVYYFGMQMKKKDFTNVWNDSKQLILTTDLKRFEDDKIISFSRGIIYFIIDSNGNLKLLKFNDSKGVQMPKDGRTVEEVDTFLKKRMMDSDQDGIEDEIEECINKDNTCVKTDPKKRDTDGDGFWDGTEAQFIKS